MKAHYLIPVLTMSNNGLRQIIDEHDTNQMCSFVELGHHLISMYLDHDDSIVSMNWDDVV